MCAYPGTPASSTLTSAEEATTLAMTSFLSAAYIVMAYIVMAHTAMTYTARDYMLSTAFAME